MARPWWGVATVASLARAIAELGLARVQLARNRLGTLRADPSSPVAQVLTPSQATLVEGVAFVIPRVAAKLPWRADCLVQALAARHWLDSAGVTSTLHLGAAKDETAGFEAHAWLSVGERIVTGDVGLNRFHPFTATGQH